MKKIIDYFICLLFVSACWVGLEYILEDSIHSSDADGIIAIILSYFITDKFMGEKFIMMLEAVWFKNGKEIYKVSPVMNIVCDDNMKGIKDIEVEDNNYKWHEYSDFNGDADDFVIRIKRG